MNPGTQQVIDSRWVRYRVCSYLSGRGISFGCGNDPIVPQQALDGGKYSLNADVVKADRVDILDNNFGFIQPSSMDHIFIGPRDKPPFKDLVSKLKIGGHLILYHLHVDPTLLRSVLKDLGRWQEKDTYVRGDQFVGVWKLLARSKNEVLPPVPKPTRRALIARYGAIGDMIMITPLIRQLAEDGYHVTMNITPYCVDVIRNNPYVGNIVLQERDMIPNQDLGAYWAEWLPEYDKYINLSESIEGKLLKVEGRRDFYTTAEWRRANCGTNYYDQTLALGGYPEVTGRRGELYFTASEEKEARHIRDKFADKFMVVWSLKGSSHHKIYPMLAPVLTRWLDTHPDAGAILVGSEADKPLQFPHPRVVEMAGKTSLRQSFALTKYADLVVGPESSIINAAGCFDTPKITMLTHSSHDNLCKYFLGDHCIQADVKCSPCNQLHYSLDSCPIISITESGETTPAWSGPICAGIGFPPEIIMSKMNEVYETWYNSSKTIQTAS